MDLKSGESPIPRVRDDDPDEVADKLSVAMARWAQGDSTDALTWLRRAAEAASDADADMRALELAKASSALADALAAAAAPSVAPAAATPSTAAPPLPVPSQRPPSPPAPPPSPSVAAPPAPKAPPTPPSRPSVRAPSRPPSPGMSPSVAAPAAPKAPIPSRPALSPMPPIRPLGTATSGPPRPAATPLAPQTAPRPPISASPSFPQPSPSFPRAAAPAQPPAPLESASSREARRASAELPSLIGDDGYADHEKTSQMPVAEILRRLEQGGRESESSLRAAERSHPSADEEFQPEATQTIDAPRDMPVSTSSLPEPAHHPAPISIPMDSADLGGEPPTLSVGVHVRVLPGPGGVVVVPDRVGATRGVRAILVPLDPEDDLRGIFDAAD